MKRETLAIADIYVPVKRRARLEQKRVDEIAASIKGQQTPTAVRAHRPHPGASVNGLIVCNDAAIAVVSTSAHGVRLSAYLLRGAITKAVRSRMTERGKRVLRRSRPVRIGGYRRSARP